MKTRRWLAILVIGAIVISFSACTYVNSKKGPIQVEKLDGDCKNIAGTWTLIEKLTKTSCSDEWVGKKYTEKVKINQNGCIAAVKGTRLKFDMTSGTISGSYSEQDGTTTIESGSLDLETLTGSWSWVWAGPGEKCRGSSDIALTK